MCGGYAVPKSVVTVSVTSQGSKSTSICVTMLMTGITMLVTGIALVAMGSLKKRVTYSKKGFITAS